MSYLNLGPVYMDKAGRNRVFQMLIKGNDPCLHGPHSMEQQKFTESAVVAMPADNWNFAPPPNAL